MRSKFQQQLIIMLFIINILLN